MAIQAIGGVSSTANVAPTGGTAPADPARRAEADNKDSTVVISRVTRTKDDGSTETTITYADGHTKIETTPPKFSTDESRGNEPNPNGSQAQASQAGARITAVDILA